MAYSDNDEASAAGESKFVQSQEDPLYHVQVKIKDENEIVSIVFLLICSIFETIYKPSIRNT